MKIAGSVALITGGASGLGEATVRHFVNNGAKVTILDLNEKRGEDLAKELGDNAIFVKTNITSEEEVQAAVDKTISSFGKIDICVSCAGIGVANKVLSKKGPFPLEQFKKAIDINVVGTFNVLRLVAGKMAMNEPNEEGERGVIINTASVAAFEGQIGQAAYSASKGAIVSMALPIAREFAKLGIRVLTIAPGIFKTPLLGELPENIQDAIGKTVPFPSRMGKPHEFALMAESVVINPMLNGECIRIDGAIRMQAK